MQDHDRISDLPPRPPEGPVWEDFDDLFDDRFVHDDVWYGAEVSLDACRELDEPYADDGAGDRFRWLLDRDDVLAGGLSGH